MKYEKSLLERIACGNDSLAIKVGFDDSIVVTSVMNHLTKMLNVRHGSVEILADYGLPDFNGLMSQFPRAISEIGREIQNCIEKYEPRLRKVKVIYAEDGSNPLLLRFDITAELSMVGIESPVWFETVLDAAGRVKIKR